VSLQYSVAVRNALLARIQPRPSLARRAHDLLFTLLRRSGFVLCAMQFSVAVRNARLDAIETAVGTSAIIKIRTGAQPANCATADSGTVLATVNLPSDYFANAGSGAKAKSGTWEDTSADAAGTAAHWRLYASDGTTCHAQGTVTATGGGGDMTVDNVVFAAAQAFTITSFTITDGNA
jgi:hypothetical protein